MNVLESAQFIAENSCHVSIPVENVDRAADTVLANMKLRRYSTKTWKDHPLHPKTADRSTVDWIFLIDLLNFSFWSDLDVQDRATPHPDRYAIQYGNNYYTGYWSLCAAIRRALDQGIPATDAAYYFRAASDDQLAAIFRSDTKEQVPLLHERIRVMREAGQILCEKFNGSFATCIEQSGKSAARLLDILVTHFPSFRDIHTFHHRSVAILKRAQILIADLWACFDGQDYGEFNDIDTITMFADYRVPQALHYLGLLKYSHELTTKLERHENLPSGCTEEIEIRGNSIWSVELLRRRIMEKKHDGDADQSQQQQQINAILLDFYIWDFAKEHQDEMMVPTHCTRSCFY